MSRPVKCRKVCQKPAMSLFGPLNLSESKEKIRLSIDEYEVIRLIDLEDFTQDQCAKQIGVARTTVQGIYSRARKKIAQALVEGKILHISGGNYKLCQDQEGSCGPGCKKRRGNNNERHSHKRGRKGNHQGH